MRHVLLPQHLAVEQPPVGGTIHDFFGQTMGTVWAVRAVLHGQLTEAALQIGVERQLDTVVAEMSHWLPDSDLARFNQAPADSWHVLPEAFFEVLTFALSIAQDSDGAYDPTAGALVNLWGFGATGRYDEPGFIAPTPERVQATLNNAGWQQLLIDPEQHRAYQPGGLHLDLSAVAKGYAVDRVSNYLSAQGIAHHLVDVGGELRGAGMKPDAMPWWVALEQPPTTTNQPTEKLSECVIALHGLSVATSGDYRRYFDSNTSRYSHTIDPRSGEPIQHGLASVTVIHPECMAADALSTALNVMGIEQGMTFAQARSIAARFVQRTAAGFTEHLTPAFLKLME